MYPALRRFLLQMGPFLLAFFLPSYFNLAEFLIIPSVSIEPSSIPCDHILMKLFYVLNKCKLMNYRFHLVFYKTLTPPPHTHTHTHYHRPRNKRGSRENKLPVLYMRPTRLLPSNGMFILCGYCTTFIVI